MNETNCCFPNALQCSARSKRTGCRCQAPAVRGKAVCRFHGAKAGAPSGPLNGRWRGGYYSLAARARRRAIRQLLALASDTLASLAP